MKAFNYLVQGGYLPYSNLNHCTQSGINYFIGYKDNIAAVCTFIEDENRYLLEKTDLREMSLTARIQGIDRVILFTNYGLELKSTEKPITIGFEAIVKLIQPTL